jgi:chorismate mutase
VQSQFRRSSALAVCAATAATLAAGAPVANATQAAGSAHASSTARAAPVHEPRRLTAFLEPAAKRLELSDEVAASKWGTGKPIDDPARERQELDDVAKRSAALGLDPHETTAVFRDQIEASKAVQRGLHARWRAHPELRPTTRPDLKKIRPALDKITGQLLRALSETRTVRGGPGCLPELALESGRVARVHHFDLLHDGALARAVASLCR